MNEEAALRAILEIEQETDDDDLRRIMAIVYSAVGLGDIAGLGSVVRMWAGSRIADVLMAAEPEVERTGSDSNTG